MAHDIVLKQAIQQVRAYYASPEYKKEVILNQENTREFLRVHKELRKLDDSVLFQKFTI
ncbi:MAG: hypothetical protein LBF39_03245 [Prevotellaceae bacterium]|jgi:hypothetical protein|nr:hypothetical protein [Prevotellaceae bacterium]